MNDDKMRMSRQYFKLCSRVNATEGTVAVTGKRTARRARKCRHLVREKQEANNGTTQKRGEGKRKQERK
jgi:hypothetical protein